MIDPDAKLELVRLCKGVGDVSMGQAKPCGDCVIYC